MTSYTTGEPELRTTDIVYDRDYWESLDDGAGYKDSVVWEDLAHIVTEVFAFPGMRVLDAGCAAGYLVRHLRRRGYETFGIDISNYALSLAGDEWEPFLRKMNLTKPRSTRGLHTAPYDLVICLETMEHIPEESLADCWENLRWCISENGLALLSICLEDVPNWNSDPTHITMHDRGWWSEQLAEAGLRTHPEAEAYVRRFRMFKSHGGIFVVSKEPM